MVVSGIQKKLCKERSMHAAVLSNAVSLKKKEVASANLRARGAKKKCMTQTLSTTKELAASEESIAQLKDWIQCLQAENS
eukprot:11848520-Ditylum_brightwellii.AAC.1